MTEARTKMYCDIIKDGINFERFEGADAQLKFYNVEALFDATSSLHWTLDS